MKKVLPKDATLIPPEAKQVFKGVMWEVWQWPQKEFDGSTKTYEMAKRPDTLLTLCIVDDQILIVNENQPGGVKFFFDLPGGKADPEDASWLEGAKRETLEEIGLEFDEWRLIEAVQRDYRSENFTAVFLAQGNRGKIEDGATRHEAGEDIKMELVSFDTFKAAVMGPNRSVRSLYRLINGCNSIEDIKNLPEFEGQEVDR